MIGYPFRHRQITDIPIHLPIARNQGFFAYDHAIILKIELGVAWGGSLA